MTWQGGGCGDPLTREPDMVARDVREQKVTAEGTSTAHPRRERSQILGGSRGKASLVSAQRLDDNLVQVPAADGRTIVACRGCADVLDGSEPGDTLSLGVYEGPSAEAGPQIIANPADYVDAPVVFRQYCRLTAIPAR